MLYHFIDTYYLIIFIYFYLLFISSMCTQEWISQPDVKIHGI